MRRPSGCPVPVGSEMCELVENVGENKGPFFPSGTLPGWGLDNEKQGLRVVGEGPLPEHISALRGTLQVSRGSPNLKATTGKQDCATRLRGCWCGQRAGRVPESSSFHDNWGQAGKPRVSTMAILVISTDREPED